MPLPDPLFPPQILLRSHLPTKCSVNPSPVILTSPPGTGKTLAYLLPLLDANEIYKTLILSPTLPLARQIVAQATAIGLQPTLLGTRPLHIERPILNAQIIIATPQRIYDHITLSNFNIKRRNYIVFDEADQMLHHTQRFAIQVLETLPMKPTSVTLNALQTTMQTRTPQILLVTATKWTPPDCIIRPIVVIIEGTKQKKLNPEKQHAKNEPSAEVELLAGRAVIEPANSDPTAPTVEENPEIDEEQRTDSQSTMIETLMPQQTQVPLGGDANISMADDQIDGTHMQLNITYAMLVVPPPKKLIAFLHVLQEVKRALVFTRSVETAKKLAMATSEFYKDRTVEPFSSELSLHQRKATLNRFNAGEIDIIVSTDALARGIDSPGLPYVISYDCPPTYTTHIHRSGRTGRAGMSGTSLTFVERQEARFFKRMVGEQHKLTKWGGRLGGGWAAWSEGEIGEQIDNIAQEVKASFAGRH